MHGRTTLGALLACAALFCTPAATAKDFEPGDLRVCNGKRCVAIMDADTLRALSSFYYVGPQPTVVRAPRTGAPAFALKFRNGYAAGMVAGARLDRTLVYGLHCGRFHRGRWYRLPARATLEARKFTAGLDPLRVDPAAVPRSC